MNFSVIRSIAAAISFLLACAAHAAEEPGGATARLILSGAGEARAGRKPATLYGTITLVMERGEWKVDQASWSGERPGIPAPVRPASSPGARKSAVQPPPAPEHKPGAAKAPCVYLPVMTAEEIERCR